MGNQRISETELILPALYLMKRNGGSIDTSSLIDLLTNLMKPEGRDAEILDGRNDTYFSQKVRNLKSHDTFERYGYATYNGSGYTITNTGAKFVEDNDENIKYLLASGFDYDDVKYSLGRIVKTKKSTILPYNEIVSEGEVTISVSKTAQRSQRLRQVAIDHFSHNGTISCDCCGFEFKSYYGETYGTPCIEIHHMKPIFQYAGVSITQTIDDALTNLLPVCPNCHRVIHRNKITAALIPDFKDELARIHHC